VERVSRARSSILLVERDESAGTTQTRPDRDDHVGRRKTSSKTLRRY